MRLIHEAAHAGDRLMVAISGDKERVGTGRRDTQIGNKLLATFDAPISVSVDAIFLAGPHCNHFTVVDAILFCAGDFQKFAVFAEHFGDIAYRTEAGHQAACTAVLPAGNPVPWWQLVNPVDLEMVDAVEDVSKVGLRIEAIQFGRLNQEREGFRPSVSSSKKPIFPSDFDGTHGTFCYIFVDGHASILKKQAKR